MTWWAWTLLWVVLVAGAGLVLYLAVRRLLRQGMALAHELGAAADLLAQVTRALDAPAGGAAAVEPSRTANRRHASTRASSRRGLKGVRSQDVR